MGLGVMYVHLAAYQDVEILMRLIARLFAAPSAQHYLVPSCQQT